jgi:uncharacterized protein YndB with AHSA1/START domain
VTADRHLKLVPTRLDAAHDDVALEIAIDAPADVVFSYFTDPAKHVQWQGVEAELDPRPGGALRITFAPGYVAVGTYVEVSPPTRIVYTWGWEDEGSDQLPAGSSTVEITLVVSPRGTILRLRHHGLPEPMLEFHSHGWDDSLAELHWRITDPVVSWNHPTDERPSGWAKHVLGH